MPSWVFLPDRERFYKNGGKKVFDKLIGYFPLLMDTVEVARGIKLSRHLFVHLSVILTVFHNQRDRDSSSLEQLFSLIHQ